MSYKSWFEKHSKKHQKIVEKLLKEGLNKEEIIKYFSFENLKEKEKDFCPLFEKNQKCHDIEDLNCYFCGCPYFRFNDKERKIKSYCSINSRFSSQIKSNEIIHQDCSFCPIPHKEGFIKKNFNLSWMEAMRECDEG